MYSIPKSSKFLFVIHALLFVASFLAFNNIDPTFGVVDPDVIITLPFLILAPFFMVFTKRYNKLLRNTPQRYIMKQLKKSIPRWMFFVLIFSVIYGAICFLYTPPESANISEDIDSIRAFSGHMMTFFAIVAIGFTALHNYKPRRCVNGHKINSDAKFCPECGSQLSENSQDSGP